MVRRDPDTVGTFEPAEVPVLRGGVASDPSGGDHRRDLPSATLHGVVLDILGARNSLASETAKIQGAAPEVTPRAAWRSAPSALLSALRLRPTIALRLRPSWRYRLTVRCRSCFATLRAGRGIRCRAARARERFRQILYGFELENRGLAQPDNGGATAFARKQHHGSSYCASQSHQAVVRKLDKLFRVHSHLPVPQLYKPPCREERRYPAKVSSRPGRRN